MAKAVLLKRKNKMNGEILKNSLMVTSEGNYISIFKQRNE